MLGVGVPAQVPTSTVHVEPTVKEPDTVGGVTFTGNPTGRAKLPPPVIEPKLLVAVTMTAMNWDASPDVVT